MEENYRDKELEGIDPKQLLGVGEVSAYEKQLIEDRLRDLEENPHPG